MNNEFKPPISAYGSIDLDELMTTIERLNKVPNYDDLIKESNKQKQKLDRIKFYIEQSNIKDMLWGKEILKIIGGNDE